MKDGKGIDINTCGQANVNTRNSTEVFDTVSVFCDCKQTI